jgi:hypothetical protein
MSGAFRTWAMAPRPRRTGTSWMPCWAETMAPHALHLSLTQMWALHTPQTILLPAHIQDKMHLKLRDITATTSRLLKHQFQVQYLSSWVPWIPAGLDLQTKMTDRKPCRGHRDDWICITAAVSSSHIVLCSLKTSRMHQSSIICPFQIQRFFSLPEHPYPQSCFHQLLVRRQHGELWILPCFDQHITVSVIRK